MAHVNRKHKDTLFRLLFSEKNNLLQLYNGVNHTHYDNPDDLEINTLQNATYMKVKNDVSFVIADEMHLYEHQSTVNLNMPLRDLFYASSLLRGMVSSKDLYRRNPVQIPTPRFLVFYNGSPEMADETVLLLSQMYEIQQREPSLELKVRVLNINSGRNGKLMKRCRPLWEYAEFVRRARKGLGSEMTEAEKAAVMEEVVDGCIRDGILEDFLKKNRESVIKNYIWEYDEEAGCPEKGIAPGTKFEDIDDDFVCPLCGAGKENFDQA